MDNRDHRLNLVDVPVFIGHRFPPPKSDLLASVHSLFREPKREISTPLLSTLAPTLAPR
jgi:hypothetical protein